jgi:hypothetical protein
VDVVPGGEARVETATALIAPTDIYEVNLGPVVRQIDFHCQDPTTQIWVRGSAPVPVDHEYHIATFSCDLTRRVTALRWIPEETVSVPPGLSSSNLIESEDRRVIVYLSATAERRFESANRPGWFELIPTDLPGDHRREYRPLFRDVGGLLEAPPILMLPRDSAGRPVRVAHVIEHGSFPSRKPVVLPSRGATFYEVRHLEINDVTETVTAPDGTTVRRTHTGSVRIVDLNTGIDPVNGGTTPRGYYLWPGLFRVEVGFTGATGPASQTYEVDLR